jgi:uncharacterized protein (DUF1697 family)
MPIFIALLRGVNVGKAKRVPMADLRALLGKLGYTGIATLLNSGNAVFRAEKGSPASHARAIAAALMSDLKVEAPVIVKSANELVTIVAENRLAEAASDPSHLLVAFAQNHSALADLSAIRDLVVAREQFLVGNHAAYLLCESGILKSKAGEALLGKVGKAVTTRNWATVLKLVALAG